LGPQIEGAGNPFDRHGLTLSCAKVIEIGNGYFGKLNKIAIGDALGFLGFEKDVEMGVFEVHERS
jgi:hypothetical protein